MKSKKVWLILIGAIILATVAWAGWQLFYPKSKDNFAQKEISIKQADVPNVQTLTYNDWSGFNFEYPSILTVKEVEMDNPKIYSSLELSGSDAKKLTVRVSDTALTNLSDWQKQFLQTNSVRKIDQTSLGELPAVRLQYGAPEMMLTVAIDNSVLYEIQSEADSGFWDRTHQDLVGSWKFTNTATTDSGSASAGASTGGDDITLVEETVE